jgi:hypothetical protein
MDDLLSGSQFYRFIPGAMRSWYRQNVDINSPEFRRTFPKIVLGMATLGLALVLLAAILTAIGYNQT